MTTFQYFMFPVIVHYFTKRVLSPARFAFATQIDSICRSL